MDVFFSDSIVEDTVAEVNQIMDKLPKEKKRFLSTRLTKPIITHSDRVSKQIMTAIKEVLHFKTSKQSDHEAVRSTLLSAICAPEIRLRDVSDLLSVYQNRNHHKLAVYQGRRKKYLQRQASHMRGQRYAAELYGFPKAVKELMIKWFEHDECGTKDTWGRKI